MFTLTLIRLNSVTRVFEKNEFNAICLLRDVEKQLNNHSVPFDKDKISNMKKGDSLTILMDNNKKVWFYYIHRIS